MTDTNSKTRVKVPGSRLCLISQSQQIIDIRLLISTYYQQIYDILTSVFATVPSTPGCEVQSIQTRERATTHAVHDRTDIADIRRVVIPAVLVVAARAMRCVRCGVRCSRCAMRCAMFNVCDVQGVQCGVRCGARCVCAMFKVCNVVCNV